MGGDTSRPDEMGSTIAGRYKVEGLLGGGGMAAVYKVRDLRGDRHVALKRGLTPAKTRSSKRKELLEREFHTLAQLAHPSIIEVYDYGVDEHGPYYTMEILDGVDLHKTGQLPWREACGLLRDVASSLALLHSRGLIHRDVSARNVRRTADGRAKLIDFGAMSSMGVAKDVVGTPPFLAPEVLQMQALDGRADLFSLGALGYYMLTGKHAFPARRFRDLRDAWRSRPSPPTKAQPDIPSALNALIMQLLSIDRGARVSSAADVMPRLCTIAGLPQEQIQLVSRAYLTTPTLIGRDAALVTVRRRMLSLARGDGGNLLIAGPPGSGRSRLLDACALEAKLVGAAVIRAGASDQDGDWGVVRVLGAQLVQLMPEQTAEAARLSRDVLSQVIDGLRSDGHTSISGAVSDRSLMIRELRDFVLSLARGSRLVIVVDDADQIDEPSAALLAALAHKTERHPLILAIAADSEAAPERSASLRFLQLVAEHVPLHPLPADQTESLLRSVFGDVPRLPMVASRIHALSQGNPYNIMALAQHLVDRGLASYEAGNWKLPSALTDNDLPESLAGSLQDRLRAVSPDALELCEILCLGDGDSEALNLASLVELTQHGEQRRVVAALDELVVARVLAADTDRYRLSQRGFLPVLETMIDPARRRWLQARFADMLARTGGDVVRRAHHLLFAGRERAAVELLASLDLRQRLLPLSLLERLVEAAERHEVKARQIHEFRIALLHRSALDVAVETYQKHAPQVLATLCRDSGLDRYNELGDLPEAQRLPKALADTQLRYQSLPEQERVYSVVDAIRSLAAFCAQQRAIALTVFDPSMIESLPQLTPLASLSPAIQLVEMSGEASAESLRGRFDRARECYEQVLTRLEAADGAGLQPVEHARSLCGIHFVLGLIDAGRGISSAENHAAVLEKERTYQVNAWRVRMLLHLTLGDTEEGARCQRRAELALLREGQQFASTTALGELICHVLCGDLVNVTHTIQTLTQLASRFAGWRPHLVYGQVSLLRLKGDPAKALELLRPMLTEVEPASHSSWPYLVSAEVLLLCDLGCVEEAVEKGLRYVDIVERQDLSPTGYVVHVATALALGKNGAFEPAVQMLERVIEAARSRAQGGVCIGSLYEARARVAAWSRDRTAYQQYVELCAGEYQHRKNPNLAAKLARLLEEARSSGLDRSDSSAPLELALSEPAPHSEYATLHSRMLECVDESDRARCALTILLQALDSFNGYLYGVNENDHVLLAALPEDEDADPELGDWFAELLEDELDETESTRENHELSPADDGETTRRARPGRERSQVSFRFTDARGRTFEPLFLTRGEAEEVRLAAVLVFHAGRDSRKRPSREVIEELADQLLNHGDVGGAVLHSGGTQTR